jgi:hypothetical protein
VNVIESSPSEEAAEIVTDPGPPPVITLLATPRDTVAAPRPETEPVPALCEKVTTVELSSVAVLP